MSEQEPRFSRKFLTILMMVTAAAILLLSRLQPTGDSTEARQPAQSEQSQSIQE